MWQQRLQCGILNGALSTKMASTPPSPQLWSLLNRIRRISYKTGRGQLDGSETPDQHVRSFQSFTTFLFEIRLTLSLILYFLIQASWHINVLTVATCSSLFFLWFFSEQVKFVSIMTKLTISLPKSFQPSPICLEAVETENVF